MNTELKTVMEDKMEQYGGVVFHGLNGRSAYGKKGRFELYAGESWKGRTDDINMAILWLSGKLHLA